MNYKEIIKHYEHCFDKYGDTPKGVDWTKESQVDIRYSVMLELINYYEKSFTLDKKFSLLDFGCGLSHLYEFIKKKDINFILYNGLEISEKFFNESKKKFPENNYIFGDILKDHNLIDNNYEFIILNGVFTEKRNVSFSTMFEYFEKMVSLVYNKCQKAIAFNVMSKQVDWEVETLFHVPLDDISNFLTKKITRNFVIRNDYGLYEYTVYLYK